MNEYQTELWSHGPLTSVCRVGSRCSSQVLGRRPLSITPVSLITSQCQRHLSSLVSYAATVPVWGLGMVGEGTNMWALGSTGNKVVELFLRAQRPYPILRLSPTVPQQADEPGLSVRKSRFLSKKSIPYLTSDLRYVCSFLRSWASPPVRSGI